MTRSVQPQIGVVAALICLEGRMKETRLTGMFVSSCVIVSMLDEEQNGCQYVYSYPTNEHFGPAIFAPTKLPER
jgi:hypothetical protein